MKISSQKKKKIKDIVKKYMLIVKMKTLGFNYMTQEEISFLKDNGVFTIEVDNWIDESYRIGRARSSFIMNDYKINTLEEFKNLQKPNLTDDEKSIIDIISEQTSTNIDAKTVLIQSTIESLINEANLKNRAFILENEYYPEIVEQLQYNKTVSEIETQLRQKSEDWADDYNRIVVTEINNAHSHGTVDEFASRNLDKKSNNLYFFKLTVKDGRLCNYCEKLYNNPDGKPKIFTLQQLNNNGTNIGKNKSEYLPVVGATHPRCRCQLLPISDGYDFNDQGEMIFVGLGKESYKK